METLPEPVNFEWDEGNIHKSRAKHGVENTEAEEALFDGGAKIFNDALHSGREERFILLGRTKNDRVLFVVFAVRSGKIRIISARDVDKKERRLYEENTKTPSI